MLYDDGSDPATAVRLYEKLIAQDKVELVLGPDGSLITDAVADATEKHRMPMVTHAATTSIFKKGRKFIFMVYPPGGGLLRGVHRPRGQEGAQDGGDHQRGHSFPESDRPGDYGSWLKGGDSSQFSP